MRFWSPTHESTQGPSNINQTSSFEDLSTLNDEYPQNGSKNGVTATRTGSDTARRAFCVSEVGALKFKSSIRLVGTSMSTRICRYVNANDCWW